jgi:putative ABC transport system permease protein
MTNFVFDLKYALRMLLKNPGFSAAAILVLALGIGANTAIFSVVDAVLLRPLPFPQADRLVRIWHVPPPKSFPGFTTFSVSAANYLDWRIQNHVFEKMAIYTDRNFTSSGGDNPESFWAAAVSYDFLSVLEARPLLGRDFTQDEDRPGHDKVVLLSYGLWQSHFGGNPNIVGQQISLNQQSYLVAGVMPREFRLPDYAEMWTPMAWTDAQRATRGEHHYRVIGRLKPGVDLKQAQAEMNTISSRLAQQYPADDKGWGALVVSLRDDLVSDVRPALLLLLGAVAFVLLIACANVANLVLAKTVGRRKEVAIRTALGATRGRVLEQILSETVLLSCVGGLLGIVFAHFGVELITGFLGDKLPRSTEIGMDGQVLGFTLAISLLVGVAAGLLPAWRLTKTDVNEALKQGLGRAGTDSGGRRTRNVLVISEVALALMLLIGAGLMVRSLWMLRNVDPGFEPRGVLTMDTPVPRDRFATPLAEANYYGEVLRRVCAVPGVESAAVIDARPMEGGSTNPIAIEGQPPVQMADQPEVASRVISTGYLSAMRIPLLQGRDFTDNDTADSRYVILISQSMAQRFWPNENPIGKRLSQTFFPDKMREVVGVVGDVKQDGLDVTHPVPTFYEPMTQVGVPSLGDWTAFGLSLVVRTTTRPSSLVSAVTAAIHQVDRNQTVNEVTTMEDYVNDTLSQQRLNMLLLAAFAGLALLLAAVGIYSVLSYSVRQRVREIGIRMALGAQVHDVLRLIVIEGMTPALTGLVIGLAGALAVARLLTSLIYGVRATDPMTFGGVSVLLASVAFFASIIPAYRATRVEPMKTLRDE